MRVLIADDHPMVRDALAMAVRSLGPEVEVAEADCYAGVCTLAGGGAFDLAVVDLNMPGMNGVDGLRGLRSAFPTLALIVASGQDDPATIRAVLAIGVSGFIPKSEPSELVLQAIRLVRAGGVYVPARHLMLQRADVDGMDGAAWRGGSAEHLPGHGMTPRQIDVLRLLMKGQSNKLIARELGLTEGTVKVHLAAILRALRVRNRTEAVVRARDLGIASQ